MKKNNRRVYGSILRGILLMAVIASLSGSVTALETPGTGTLTAMKDGKKVDFPLKHTDVEAEISGFIARVDVVQHYENPFDETIEAVYVFPLPENAAVDEMTMHIGSRVIRGEIKKREEAREIYEQAKQAGHTASLLEQERPNIFTQSLANIHPGDQIEIMISYVQDLKYDDGTYEFVFPMVVGPRFIPGAPAGKNGAGWAADTDQVPDASRITPPVLKPGRRSGHDIDLMVMIDAGVPIMDIQSKSHEIVKEEWDGAYAAVRLAPHDTIPNKDFILSYRVAGKKPEAALLTHRDAGGGFFMLMVQPEELPDQDEIVPKEMIFIVDCSGSMSGAPINQARQAMKRCIAGLNPDDTFQIIRFSSSASKFSPHPLTVTDKNIEKGLDYVQSMWGSGGTVMIEGIKAALGYPSDPERMRIVLLMTDGYIGNETQILGAVEDKIGNARMFAFGVGSSVNRYLLERMTEIGRGEAQYVRPDEPAEKPVNKFYDRINNPCLTNISIDWGSLEVRDVYPQRVPDLFDSQPVVLFGRFSESGEETVVIQGKTGQGRLEIPIVVQFPENEKEHDVLGTLWARKRIHDLMNRMFHREDPDIVQQVTDLALEFNLMTKYTSFVAVEEKVRKEPDGTIVKVAVPVELPEFVEYEGVFGDESVGISYDSFGRSKASVHGGSSARGLMLLKGVESVPASPPQRYLEKKVDSFTAAEPAAEERAEETTIDKKEAKEFSFSLQIDETAFSILGKANRFQILNTLKKELTELENCLAETEMMRQEKIKTLKMVLIIDAKCQVADCRLTIPGQISEKIDKCVENWTGKLNFGDGDCKNEIMIIFNIHIRYEN